MAHLLVEKSVELGIGRMLESIVSSSSNMDARINFVYDRFLEPSATVERQCLVTWTDAKGEVLRWLTGQCVPQ